MLVCDGDIHLDGLALMLNCLIRYRVVGYMSVVSFLQYLATVSTFTAAVPFQSPAPHSGTVRDPTINAECFRRLLKTYLFSRY